jgi:hypothetical protein
MRETADHLVSWLFQRVQLTDRPPIDLVELAQRMGVMSILEAQMVEDGRLEQRSGAAAIYVRSDLSPARRQFTIAHELGHRLLLHPGAPATAYRRRLTGDEEERLCDDIAAAILLPRRWVHDQFCGSPQRLRTIRRMAAMSSASLSASLVRLREVHQWPYSLLWFSPYEGRWRLSAPAGVPSGMHGRLRTTLRTNQVLEEIGAETAADVFAVLPIGVNTRELQFRAELSVRGGSAIALVDLSRSVELHALSDSESIRTGAEAS